jgi:hypothetical protein
MIIEFERHDCLMTGLREQWADRDGALSLRRVSLSMGQCGWTAK